MISSLVRHSQACGPAFADWRRPPSSRPEDPHRCRTEMESTLHLHPCAARLRAALGLWGCGEHASNCSTKAKDTLEKPRQVVDRVQPQVFSLGLSQHWPTNTKDPLEKLGEMRDLGALGTLARLPAPNMVVWAGTDNTSQHLCTARENLTFSSHTQSGPLA